MMEIHKLEQADLKPDNGLRAKRLLPWPDLNVCNEFYELAGAKFSTSRNHLVLGVDLLDRVPRDLVRFHLCHTAPECQRTNFTESELRERTGRLLVGPWNVLADALSALSSNDTGAALPTDAEGRRRAAALAERFALCYEMRRFSVRQVAELIATHVDRLATAAWAAVREPASAGNVFLEVRTLLAHAAPVLVDVAAELADNGVDIDPCRPLADAVRAFRLPPLPDARAPHDSPAPTAMLETLS
ncbi:MAG TPA: class I tRNA ligase family protein [Pseudonocardiaceae bacterium]|nr:class I tRNA ligase family protein [Pseudonocardiaceae bacterium]